MNTPNKTSRVLGIAFVLQFVTSIVSGVFLQPALIVPDNIAEEHDQNREQCLADEGSHPT